MSSRTIGGAVSLLLVTWAGDPAQSQRELRERHVIVGVVGSGDTPVVGLGANEFVVRENDVAREVLRATPAPPPTHVVLLVDDSAVTELAIPDLRQGLTAFTRRLQAAGPATQISLHTIGGRPMVSVDFTTDPALLSRGIDRLFAQSGTGAYLLEAIVDASVAIRRRKAERPVIVAFVDEHGPEFSNVTHDRIEEILRQTGASLWAVTLQGRGTDLLTREGRERGLVLGDGTADSGGMNKVVLSRQGIGPAFATLAGLLTSLYDVTYSRPESLVPPDRLEVTVKRSGARALAPRWTGR
jgi:hypothetical protein